MKNKYFKVVISIFILIGIISCNNEKKTNLASKNLKGKIKFITVSSNENDFSKLKSEKTRKIKYNKNGAVEENTFYLNNKMISHVEFAYNIDNGLQNEKFFDKTGKLISKTLFKYNNSVPIKVETFDKDNRIISEGTYEYFDNNKPKKLTVRSKINGQIKFIQEFDQQDHMISSISYDTNGKIYLKTKFKYENSVLRTIHNCSFYPNNCYEEETLITVSRAHIPIKKIFFENDQEQSKKTYKIEKKKYDDYGNCIEIWVYKNKGEKQKPELIKTIFIDIEYYSEKE